MIQRFLRGGVPALTLALATSLAAMSPAGSAADAPTPSIAWAPARRT